MRTEVQFLRRGQTVKLAAMSPTLTLLDYLRLTGREREVLQASDWNRPDWGGPCPPIGRHRYFFKLYALDTTLSDLAQPSKATVEKAMQGHVVAQAAARGELDDQAPRGAPDH